MVRKLFWIRCSSKDVTKGFYAVLHNFSHVLFKLSYVRGPGPVDKIGVHWHLKTQLPLILVKDSFITEIDAQQYAQKIFEKFYNLIGGQETSSSIVIKESLHEQIDNGKIQCSQCHAVDWTLDYWDGYILAICKQCETRLMLTEGAL